MDYKKEFERKILFENLVELLQNCQVVGDYCEFAEFQQDMLFFPIFGIQEITSEITQQKDTVTIRYNLSNRKSSYQINFTYYKEEIRDLDFTYVDKTLKDWHYTNIIYRFLNHQVVKVIEKKTIQYPSGLMSQKRMTLKEDYYKNGRFMCSKEYKGSYPSKTLTREKYQAPNNNVLEKNLYTGKGSIYRPLINTTSELSKQDLQKIYQFDRRFQDVYKMVRRKGKY